MLHESPEGNLSGWVMLGMVALIVALIMASAYLPDRIDLAEPQPIQIGFVP